MTPIKDMGSSEKPKRRPKLNGTEPPDPDAAWKPDGTGGKVRNGRLLPFEAKIRELLVGFSGIAAIAGDEFVSAAIDGKRDELAYGYAKLAKENASVKRVLEVIFTGNAWAEALIPTAGLVIVVGWHYGFVPDNVGVPMTMASGIVPMSREAEKEMRKQGQASGGESPKAN